MFLRKAVEDAHKCNAIVEEQKRKLESSEQKMESVEAMLGHKAILTSILLAIRARQAEMHRGAVEETQKCVSDLRHRAGTKIPQQSPSIPEMLPVSTSSNTTEQADQPPENESAEPAVGAKITEPTQETTPEVLASQLTAARAEVGNLQAQLTEARRQSVFASQLDQDLAELQHKLSAAHTERQTTVQKMESDAVEQREQSEAELRQVELDAKKVELEAQELREMLDAEQQKVEKLETATSDAEANSIKVVHMEETVVRMKADVSSEQQTIADLREELREAHEAAELRSREQMLQLARTENEASTEQQTAQTTIDELREKLGKAVTKGKSYAEEKTKLQSELDVLSDKTNVLQQELSSKEDALQASKSREVLLKTSVEAAEQRATVAEAKGEELGALLSSSKAVSEEVTAAEASRAAELASLKSTLDTTQGRTTILEKELAEAQAKLDAQVAESVAATSASETQVAALETEIMQSKDHQVQLIAAHETERDELRKSLAETTDELAVKQTALDQAEQREADLNAAVESGVATAAELEESKRKLSIAEQAVQGAQQEVDALKETVEATQSDLGSKEQALLEQLTASQRAEADTKEKLMAAVTKGKEISADRKKVKQELAAAQSELEE
eukprot:gene12127-14330_t